MEPGKVKQEMSALSSTECQMSYGPYDADYLRQRDPPDGLDQQEVQQLIRALSEGNQTWALGTVERAKRCDSATAAAEIRSFVVGPNPRPVAERRHSHGERDNTAAKLFDSQVAWLMAYGLPSFLIGLFLLPIIERGGTPFHVEWIPFYSADRGLEGNKISMVIVGLAVWTPVFIVLRLCLRSVLGRGEG